MLLAHALPSPLYVFQFFFLLSSATFLGFYVLS